MAPTFEYKGGKGKVMMMKLNKMINELYQMPDSEREEIRSRNNGHIDHIEN